MSSMSGFGVKEVQRVHSVNNHHVHETDINILT